MIEYAPDLLEKYLRDSLNTTDDMLKVWETNKYSIDESITNKFFKEIKDAPAIAFVGDYDVDGTFATYIGSKGSKETFPDKKQYLRIPRRFSEGYGINPIIADEIKEKLPKGSVVITVDNGISAAEVLENLERDGYKVICTDHHELKEGAHIPNVTMVIDPAVPGCDAGFGFKKWCGAAVIYKLFEPMISEKLATELETFAGIATIADCMELTEGNWGIVRHSIDNFKQGKEPASLEAMAVAMKQDPKFVDEGTYGFYLGPCCNAAGRLLDGGPNLVLKYLFAPTEEKLTQLIELNNTRKQLRDEEYDLVKAEIERTHADKDCPIWVKVDGLHEGIVGILAGKVAEDYGVPAIVLTNAKDEGIIKGSARSVEGINIFKYLSEMNDLFKSMGGHEGAAGLSLPEVNFEKAKAHQIKRTNIKSKEIISEPIHIKPNDIPEINDILVKFKPFGEGNPAPIFDLDFNMKDGGKMIGKEHNHLVLEPDDRSYKVVHWFHEPNELKNSEIFGMEGKISGSAFNGIETPTFSADKVYDIVRNRRASNKAGGMDGIKTGIEERNGEISEELDINSR